MDSFETFPEQDEAKRLLRAALAEGPAHAYLFHGPRGVGKRRAALAFAGELLGDRRTGSHATSIPTSTSSSRSATRSASTRSASCGATCTCARSRPTGASTSCFGAHLMNEDAADALLKDLEEPPPYAVIVLVADELGPAAADDPLALPARALPPALAARDQGLPLLARPRRASRWRRSRGSRPGGSTGPSASSTPTPESGARALIELARSVYLDPQFDPGRASRSVTDVAHERGAKARAAAEEQRGVEETAREAEQRSRRAGRGAEREEILDALDLLTGWYRDLMVVAAGAERCGAQLATASPICPPTAVPERGPAAERAAATVRDVWRSFEFNVQPGLALEALFVRLRRDLGGTLSA